MQAHSHGLRSSRQPCACSKHAATAMAVKIAVYLARPAKPSSAPSSSHGPGRLANWASIRRMVCAIRATLSAINSVSGSSPMPSTCNTGASKSAAKAHKPARCAWGFSAWFGSAYASSLAPRCTCAAPCAKSSKVSLYTPKAVANHSSPGISRSTATGAPRATSGHCTQPTSGGWSK